METPEFNKPLYPLPEVAAITKIHVKTLRGWVKSFELPALKKKGRYYVTTAELKRLLGLE